MQPLSPAPSSDSEALERDADRAADAALAASATPGVHGRARSGALQLRRLPAATASAPHAVPASVSSTLSEPGRPLETGVRRDMESRFGHDFSQVRVHTGASAQASTRDVAAQAYTVGAHIAFGPNRYAPGDARGRHLLAHELAHVIQQGRSGLRLQRRTLKEEPAAGCGICFGMAALAGIQAHKEIQTAWVLPYLLKRAGAARLAEVPITCKGQKRRPDIVLQPSKGKWIIGSIKPARQSYYNDGANVFKIYSACIKAADPTAIVLPLRVPISGDVSLMPFPNPGAQGCGTQKFKVNAPDEFGVYGYFCDPGRRELLANPSCTCKKKKKKNKKSKQKKSKGKQKKSPKKGSKKSPNKGTKKKPTKRPAKKTPPKKTKPKSKPKKPAKKGKPKGSPPTPANVGFGLSIFSVSGGAGNAGVGVSILSTSTAYGTAGAGVSVLSDSVAAGAAGAGATVQSDGMGAGVAGAGTSSDSTAIAAGAAGAGSVKKSEGAAAGAAGAGEVEDSELAGAGVAGHGKVKGSQTAGAGSTGSGSMENVQGKGTGASGKADAKDVSGDAGKSPAPGQDEGAKSDKDKAGSASDKGSGAGGDGKAGIGDIDKPGQGTEVKSDAAAAGGDKDKTGDSKGSQDKSGEGKSGQEKDGSAGDKSAGDKSDGAATPAKPGDQAASGSAEKSGGADLQTQIEIALGKAAPDSKPEDRKKAAAEAVKINAMLKNASAAQKALLSKLAQQDPTGQYKVPAADWVGTLLKVTEGITEQDLQYLMTLNWQPSNLSPAELRKRVLKALENKASKGAPDAKPASADKPASGDKDKAAGGSKQGEGKGGKDESGSGKKGEGPAPPVGKQGENKEGILVDADAIGATKSGGKFTVARKFTGDYKKTYEKNYSFLIDDKAINTHTKVGDLPTMTLHWVAEDGKSYYFRQQYRISAGPFEETDKNFPGKTLLRFTLETTNTDLIDIAPVGMEPFLLSPGRIATYRVFKP